MDPLAKLIKDAAYLEGEFILRSGKKSNYYLDKYLFETQPTILKQIAEKFATHLTSDIDLIGGAELGGIPLATAVAMVTGKPFIIIRNKKKDYGTSKPYEGPSPAGKKILLVEDIVTTAGQVIEAANTLKELGGSVAKVVAVIDRQEGGRENVINAGYAFASLFTKVDLGI
jgi:orotate phosphoribosyltransferase